MLIGVADSQIKGQIRTEAPVVLHEGVQNFLVPVVNVVAGVALAEDVGAEIAQKLLSGPIFVVAAHALGEALRRDDIAEVATKLKGVITMNYGQVVDDLVVVFDSELRSIRIRPDV